MMDTLEKTYNDLKKTLTSWWRLVIFTSANIGFIFMLPFTLFHLFLIAVSLATLVGCAYYIKKIENLLILTKEHFLWPQS